MISLIWSCGCGLWPWEKASLKARPSGVTTMILARHHLFGVFGFWLTAVDPRLGCVCQTETGASRTVGVVTRKDKRRLSTELDGPREACFFSCG